MAGNRPRVGTTDVAQRPEDTPVKVAVVANDSDPDGDALVLVGLTQPAHGAASVLADTVRYAPHPNYAGTDSLLYVVGDGNGGLDSARVVLAVTPVNDAPHCSAARPSRCELGPPDRRTLPVTVLGVTDVEGDAATITVARITQVEPIDEGGGGRFVPDGAGLRTATAYLRAERLGNGRTPENGRVYVVHFAAVDAAGARTPGTVPVAVPHDPRQLRQHQDSPAGAAHACRYRQATAPRLTARLGLARRPRGCGGERPGRPTAAGVRRRGCAGRCDAGA
ncbi:MAG: cadherin-like domain-containing protein [Candidatus Latescibacterota bacterium]